MSTGNYDHGNFVRVDCAVSAKQFYTNAVHEVAHFTLIKQTFFGLLCFFLRQDTRDARSPLALGLRTLEQAFECTNECYARVKELLICTRFSDAGPQEREALLASQRTQAYYSRCHMERLEPILRQYDLAARYPIFPDRLFLMAAEIEVAPLLDCGFERLPQLQSLMLSRPEDVYPDHRLALLLQAFSSLLQRDPPERITEKRLAREAGLSCTPLSTRSMKRFFRRMAAAFPSRPMLQALLLGNLQRLSAAPYPAPTAENLETSFRLSLSDCVIPGALEPRFELHTNEPPIFRSERNVLYIFLEPELLFSPEIYQTLPSSPRSAVLRFTDTHAGRTFSDAYAADLEDLRHLLNAYSGVVCLYLDDYAQYHRLGPFRTSPVFFRADVPWNGLEAELALQGFRIERAFLQRYSDCVFFFFGFDPLGNVVFSMPARWEIEKVYSAMGEGAIARCGSADADCYGPHPWHAFRDVISAAAEDRSYGSMGCGAFRRLRLC